MAATCIGVSLLVVLLECLRRLGREYDTHIIRSMHARGALLASTTIPSCPPCDTAPPVRFRFKASPLQQLVRSVIHAVTFGVGYIVMLLAMYFNGFIIVSIIIGAGMGKYVADWLVVDVVPGLPGASSSTEAKGIEEPTVCCG